MTQVAIYRFDVSAEGGEVVVRLNEDARLLLLDFLDPDRRYVRRSESALIELAAELSVVGR